MRLKARALALLASLGLATGALAAGLQVSPTSLTIAARQNADGLWLANTGGEALRAQVRVYRWTQDGGKDVLTPTREVLASPPMLELEVGVRQQLVRIIRLGAPPTGNSQEAYRVIINELPVDRPGAKGLQFALQYSLPVFTLPAGAAPAPPQLQWALVHAGEQLFVEVANSGGTHAQIADLAYTDAAGARSTVAPGLLGYVLPGARMRWLLKSPAAQALAGGGHWEAMINGTVGQSVTMAAPTR